MADARPKSFNQRVIEDFRSMTVKSRADRSPAARFCSWRRRGRSRSSFWSAP